MQDQQAHKNHRKRQAGLTLLELIITCAILLVLASAAMPMARFTVRRQKEAELRRQLREMRDAIDRYKDAADRNLIRVEAGTEGYPPDLQTLVTGVDITSQGTPGVGLGTPAGTVAGQSGSAFSPAPGFGAGAGAGGFGSSLNTPFGSQAPGAAANAGRTATQHVRFLRHIPVDPMTGRAEWGMRSVADDPQSTSWGGKDVFDVFSMSNGTALDGTHYQDW
jgi:general secretion pathway protein G